MNEFESSLNDILVTTFNNILKYEEQSLQKLSEFGVTVSEAHILESIGKFASASISEIANDLCVAVPTITIAVKKLQTKGFVSKQGCTMDNRRMLISLTDTGTRINKAHRLFHLKMVRNIAKEFDESEKSVLLKAVNKLNTFFQNKSDD